MLGEHAGSGWPALSDQELADQSGAPWLAALIETNVNVQRLTVEAAYTGDPEAAKRAAMLDPRTAALLPLDQIASLVEELLLAHRQWLPQFRLPEPAARGAAQA